MQRNTFFSHLIITTWLAQRASAVCGLEFKHQQKKEYFCNGDFTGSGHCSVSILIAVLVVSHKEEVRGVLGILIQSHRHLSVNTRGVEDTHM